VQGPVAEQAQAVLVLVRQALGQALGQVSGQVSGQAQ
jgi:hypothetical protein